MAVAAATGCDRRDHPIADTDDVAPPPPASALARTTPDLDLATSTQGESEHAPEAVTVLVTRKQLLVGGDPIPIATFPDGVRALAATGLPARYKRSGPDDLYLPELGNSLTYWHDRAAASARARDASASDLAVAVLADASTPYRILLEVLYTAGQVGFARYEVAVRAADGSLRWLTPRPPPWRTRWRQDPREARALSLAVGVDDAGYWVRVRGRHIAPGCAALGPGSTVPKVAEAYDDRGLTACARKLKALSPWANEDTDVVLSASPAIDIKTIASTMDALRGTADTGPLFPDVDFAGIRDAEGASDDDLADRGKDLARLYDRPVLWGEGAPTGKGKGKVGSASIGGAAVSGGSVAQASSVVAGMAAGFRRCYNKGLAEDPNMKGSVRLTAKIGPTGEVLSVSPSGHGLSGTVVSCVSARVSSAQFAPPEGGSATIVIPVTFVSE
jgi:hypothetical protein